MNTAHWKKIKIDYLDSNLVVEVPQTCDILQMNPVSPLPNIPEAIEYSFQNPIHSETIDEIVSYHPKPAEEITVAIAVSDNTRPVPYNCTNKKNILSPVINRLERSGINRQNIRIIIATGTHAPTSIQWKKEAFGDDICENYIILDHDCRSEDLIPIGLIKGVPVKINRDFIQSDIHIVTGLVEAHFMAGVSGGRKAICPGLVNLEATQVFHGPEFMADTNADNLVLYRNPCHEFALEVALRTRVDFTVNVLLNGDMDICGITTGDLEISHQKALAQLKSFSELKLDKKYDIVLTHGGKGAVNHYQAVKGAWAALPAVDRGGHIILLAHNQDNEPIGSPHYKNLIKKLKKVGIGNFSPLLSKPDWVFTHDQWEVQKWEQVFMRIGGEQQLIYCTTNIPPEILAALPGLNGYQFVEDSSTNITNMLQQVIYYCVKQKENASMAFLKEGPYIVLKNQ